MAETISESTQRLDQRLKTLDTFATSVNSVISAATTCGSTFQHEVERERQNFNDFIADMDASPSSGAIDDDFFTGLTSFFETMEKCGQAFASLAASLTFHTAEPLLKLSKDLAHLHDEIEDQLWLHDKQVDDCTHALTVAEERQVRATADLHIWERERRTYDANKNKIVISQLFTKQNSGRLDRKLRVALSGQHAATEEVAVRAQAVELARKQLESNCSDLFVLIQKAETRLCHHVVTSLTAVAGAVEENVEGMRVAADTVCTGAKFIRRALNAEDDGGAGFSRTSIFGLNPFVDDRVSRLPDEKFQRNSSWTDISGTDDPSEFFEDSHGCTMSPIMEERESELQKYRKETVSSGAAESESRGTGSSGISEAPMVVPRVITVQPPTDSDMGSIADWDAKRKTEPAYEYTDTSEDATHDICLKTASFLKSGSIPITDDSRRTENPFSDSPRTDPNPNPNPNPNPLCDAQDSQGDAQSERLSDARKTEVSNIVLPEELPERGKSIVSENESDNESALLEMVQDAELIDA